MSSTNVISEALAVERHTKVIGQYLSGMIGYHEMAQFLLDMAHEYADANNVDESDKFYYRLVTITSELLCLAEGMSEEALRGE